MGSGGGHAPQALTRDFEKRPWGKFVVLGRYPGITVKIITVNPGSRLSLQKHALRDEEWLCLEGNAVAQVDGTKRRLRPGSRAYVPRNHLHRLSSKSGAEILEVGYGDFRESDIVRVEDDYGRIRKKD